MRGLRRVRVWPSAGLMLASVAAVGFATSATAVALQEADTTPGGLVDRLVAIEDELPGLPPDDVILTEGETWAEFTGDFTGARFELDALADRVRDLFVDAEEADGPVPAAVADAARAILIQREGYELLATWEQHDLAVPLDGVDDDGVATAADELYGLAETGLALLLDANERWLAAHEILRDSEFADAEDQQVFAATYDAARAFESRLRPLVHRAVSYDTTQVLRATDRFGSTAPGTDARARTMRVVCIDREAYVAGDTVAFELPETLAALGQVPAVDCPDLDNGNEVRAVAD